MPTKKSGQKSTAKKNPFVLSNRERQSLEKGGKAEMKKLGLKTPEELAAYYDKRRSY